MPDTPPDRPHRGRRPALAGPADRDAELVSDALHAERGQHRLARDRPPLRGRRRPAELGGHRLSARGLRVPHALRQALRPSRPQAGVPRRDDGLHRLLGPVRAGRQRGGPDRVPGGPGRRHRHGLRHRHRHPDLGHPAGRARPGARHHGCGRLPGPRLRSLCRRLADRAPLLARGLSGQRPARPRPGAGDPLEAQRRVGRRRAASRSTSSAPSFTRRPSRRSCWE